jgi:microcin C transport system permease protein
MPLSPINQRRLKVFLKNKRALSSLILFALIFLVTLFAEFIANDKPILLSYESELYVPALISYPETTFGGDFETEADYSDPYITELIESKGWMLWPIIPFSYDTHIANLPTPAPSPPNSDNWLGTDDQARDVIARVIYGLRISILFALALTIGSTIFGVAAGAIQGYYGGTIDLLGQRFLEIWSGLPVLFLLIILSSIITPNIWWLLGIMLLFSWTQLVDVVRAEFLRGRNLDYVRAARAMGLGNPMIMVRHILPNALVATITFVPFLLASAITTLTALDFLGFGLPPGSASLGELVAQGKANLQAPWLGITAFVVLSLILTLLVFIGEGVRDALDPRLTQ